MAHEYDVDLQGAREIARKTASGCNVCEIQRGQLIALVRIAELLEALTGGQQRTGPVVENMAKLVHCPDVS